MSSKQAANAVAVNSKKRLIIFCSLFTVLCSLFLLRSAAAHAQLVLAEPTNGATLDESPAEIHLTFNENLGESSQVIVIGENFLRVAGVKVREIVFNEIFVDVPTLEPNVYTVQYDVVSEDGHLISGSYEFAVERTANWNMLWMLLLVILVVIPIGYFGRSHHSPSFFG